MNIDIKGIIEGTLNSVFIKEEIEKLSEYRLSICNTCEHYSSNIKKKGLQVLRLDKFCADCGCNMYLKSRKLAAECPLGTRISHFPLKKQKWTALINDEVISEKIIDETPGLKDEVLQYKIKLLQNKEDEHGS